MADPIDLAAVRAARLGPAPIGRKVVDDAVNSGRSPFLGTVEQETALVRKLEALVERLKRRAATGSA